MKKLQIGVTVISSVLVAAPVCAQRHLRADSALVGCYAITWSNGTTPKPYFPDTVRLTLRAARWNGFYAVHVDTVWMQRAPMFQFLWKRLGADSVAIAETNGFTGVELKLSVTPNGFEGVATAFSDALDPQHPFLTWHATAIRLACKRSA